MAVGAYGSGFGTDLSGFSQRSDWDLSAVWTLNNMGLGNLASIRERQREFDLARTREYRFRDVVAKEVVVAWNDLRSASRRIDKAEQELRQAELSARQNLEGLGAIIRVAGGVNILVIRPQEVVQSLQALNQAYYDFYGVIAEYNRAQFRMYRALGNPAQRLEGHLGLGGPALEQAPPKNQPNGNP